MSLPNNLLAHSKNANGNITQLVCPFFTTSYAQDPDNLLNGYNYRQNDISFLSGTSATNNRLAYYSQYVSLQGGTQQCSATDIESYSNTMSYQQYKQYVSCEKSYATPKIFLDHFKNAIVPVSPLAVSYYAVGSSSQTASSSRQNATATLFCEYSYFQLPENLVFQTSANQDLVWSSVNAGDFVVYNGVKYLWVKHSGSSTYSTYYDKFWLIEASGL